MPRSTRPGHFVVLVHDVGFPRVLQYSLGMRQRHIAPSLIALLAILYGCGGSSVGVASTTSPSVTISWPAITRDFSAPELANSAAITLTIPGSATPYTWSVDRPSGNAAVNQPAVGPTLARLDTPATIQIDFTRKPDPSTTGPLMGRVILNVRLLPSGAIVRQDGTALGVIGYLGDGLTDLQLKIGSSCHVGEAVQVTAQATNAFNEYAVPMAYATVRVDSLGGTAQVNGNTLTGLSVGPVRISGSYGGVSATEDAHVYPAYATPTRFALEASSIAWDSTRGTFWASFGSNGRPYQNCIAQVSPTTGTISNVIAGLPDASTLKVSPDGTIAAVACGADLYTVNLSSGSIGSPLTPPGFYGPATITDIDFNPFNSSELSICGRSLVSFPSYGPAVLRNGTWLSGASGAATESVYVTADTLVAVGNTDLPKTAYEFKISGSSLSRTKYVEEPGEIGQNLILVGTYLISPRGSIVSASDFRSLLTMQDVGGGIAYDSPQRCFWLLHSTTEDRVLLVSALDSVTFQDRAAVSLRFLPNEYALGLTRYGSKGLALQTNLSLYVLPTAPGL